jgi:hypothetical protein
MNIFEVFLNCESQNSSPFVKEILNAQNYWVSMKGILDKLFEENTFDSILNYVFFLSLKEHILLKNGFKLINTLALLLALLSAII